MHTTMLPAQTQSDRQSVEQALRGYFQNYGNGLSGFPVTASLSRVDIDNSSRSITITASDRFGEQEFTPSVVRGIYDRIRSLLPRSYHNYSVSVVTHGHRIDDLVPNRLRDHHDIDHSRRWQHISYKGKPWVSRTSRPNDIDHGLLGRHLTIAAFISFKRQ